MRPTFNGIFLTSLLLAACMLSAAAQPVRLECSVSAQEITVGDPIEFRVLIRSTEAGIELGSLPRELDFGKLEVLDSEALESARNSEEENEDRIEGRVFRITAFEPGTFDTPAIEVSYRLTDQGESMAVSCPPIPIEVTPVLPEEAQDLRDIKQPRELPAEPSYWWLWLLMGAAVLAGAWWFWQRRSAPEEPATGPAEPALPPYEEAVAALDQLAGQKLPQQGESKRHYVELSEILRRYIQRVFEIPAREMTSGEIVLGLKSRECSEELRGKLRKLLYQCDMVKFAKSIPGAETDRKMLDQARRWLDDTRPAPVVETSAETGEEERDE